LVKPSLGRKVHMDPVELPIEETVRLKREHDAAVEEAHKLRAEIVNETLQLLTPEVLDAIAPCEVVPRSDSRGDGEDGEYENGLWLSEEGSLYTLDEDRRVDVTLAEAVERFEVKPILRGLQKVFVQTNKGRKKAIAKINKETEQLEAVLQMMGSYQ
jgi:hypothetical protein